MSFSPPAAACVTVNVPRAPPSKCDQRRHVVDDLAARHQRADVGDDARDVGARHEARQVLRVAADRAHHQRQAAALRVEYPAEAVVLRTVLDACREAALDVLDLDQAHRPRARRRAPGAAHTASSDRRRSRARSRTGGLPRARARPGRRPARKSCVTGLSPTTSRPASSAAAANG